MARPSKYSAEVQERSVRLVLDQAEQHGSQWAAIQFLEDVLRTRIAAGA